MIPIQKPIHKPVQKLRLAVVGVGKLGEIHVKLLTELCLERRDIFLTGVYDASLVRAADVAARFSTQPLHSLDAVAEACDAAFIVSTTSAHFEIASHLIQRGIHLFIEKPITATLEEADKLIALQAASGVKIQVGHIERFNPALVSIERYLQNPMFITAERLAGFQLRATDVSVVLDLMIHDIDLILSLVKSEVTHISASGMAVFSNEIDIANARVEFANGAAANVTASRLSRTKARKMRFFCTEPNSYAALDFSTGKAEVFRLMERAAPKRKTSLKEAAASKLLSLFGDLSGVLNGKTIDYIAPDVPKGNALKNEQSAFIDAVLGKRDIAVSSHDGRRALDVATRITEAIETKQRLLRRS